MGGKPQRKATMLTSGSRSTAIPTNGARAGLRYTHPDDCTRRRRTKKSRASQTILPNDPCQGPPIASFSAAAMRSFPQQLFSGQRHDRCRCGIHRRVGRDAQYFRAIERQSAENRRFVRSRADHRSLSDGLQIDAETRCLPVIPFRPQTRLLGDAVGDRIDLLVR